MAFHRWSEDIRVVRGTAAVVRLVVDIEKPVFAEEVVGTIEVVVVVVDSAEFAVQDKNQLVVPLASRVFAGPWEALVVPVLEDLLQMAVIG